MHHPYMCFSVVQHLGLFFFFFFNAHHWFVGPEWGTTSFWACIINSNEQYDFKILSGILVAMPWLLLPFTIFLAI